MPEETTIITTTNSIMLNRFEEFTNSLQESMQEWLLEMCKNSETCEFNTQDNNENINNNSKKPICTHISDNKWNQINNDSLDSKSFQNSRYGRAIVVEKSEHIDRGAINTTHVRNMQVSDAMIQHFRPRIDDGLIVDNFDSIFYGIDNNNNIDINNIHNNCGTSKIPHILYSVSGISAIIHPRFVHIPTIHFNFRFFELKNLKNHKNVWWFGGGVDLTPYVVDEKLFKEFHRDLKSTCSILDDSCYDEFKEFCDRYFYLKHRDEHRGIGGIFFDDFNRFDKFLIFDFIQSIAKNSIFKVYIDLFNSKIYPEVQKGSENLENAKKSSIYDYENFDKDRQWQLLRRGRYVEFNLIYDRGTKFGLSTIGCNADTVLVSLPLECHWKYDFKPESKEQIELLKVLKNPKSWATIQ